MKININHAEKENQFSVEDLITIEEKNQSIFEVCEAFVDSIGILYIASHNKDHGEFWTKVDHHFGKFEAISSRNLDAHNPLTPVKISLDINVIKN